jgi:short subunit dehydrogenase-like uncharacterized protein
MKRQTLITWVKANRLTSGLVLLILAGVLWYFAGSINQAVRDRTTDAVVEKLEKQSDQQLIEAQKASGARAAEDERRRVQIKPAVEHARRARETARAKTEKAEREYENSRKKIPDAAGADLRELRRRNCANYADLYPDEPECPD